MFPAPTEMSATRGRTSARKGSVLLVLQGLDAAGKQAGDEELALVKSLPKVVELDLHGTAVTDKGLEVVEARWLSSNASFMSYSNREPICPFQQELDSRQPGIY